MILKILKKKDDTLWKTQKQTQLQQTRKKK